MKKRDYNRKYARGRRELMAELKMQQINLYLPNELIHHIDRQPGKNRSQKLQSLLKWQS